MRGLRIDSHAHIFNGEDLDAYGYLSQELRPHTLEGFVATPVKALFQILTSSAKWAGPSMKLEHEVLDAMLCRRDDRMKNKKEFVHTFDANARIAQADMLQKELREICWKGTAKSDQQVQKEEAHKIFLKAAKELGVDLTMPITPFEQGQLPVLSTTGLRRHPLAHSQTYLSVGEWFGGFISSMCDFRIFNAVRLMRRYPDIDLFVVSTLDYDEWFRYRSHGNLKNPSEPLRLQSEAMGKITVLTEGQILHRTGWCPLRQARHDNAALLAAAKAQGKRQNDETKPPNPLAILDHACKYDGSLGAKLYPVLGFRPMNNALVPNKQFEDVAKPLGHKEEGFELGIQLDHSLRMLYDQCASEGYGVMAHTNFSHGGGPAAMRRADPEHWRSVLAKHPDLRVTIGHFGGFDEGPGGNKRARIDGMDSDWPMTIARMMSPDNQLYADLSFVSAKHASKRAAQLRTVIDAGKPGIVAKRLLYGTDWHELLSDGECFSYYSNWTRMFEDEPTVAPYAADILGQNATHALGLHEEKTRTRLASFFKKWKVRPSWPSRMGRPHVAV